MSESRIEIIIPPKKGFDNTSLRDQTFAKTKVDDWPMKGIAEELDKQIEMAIKNQGVPIIPPQPDSYNVSSMFFYRTGDLPIRFLGIDYNFDVFLGNLTRNSIMPNGQIKKSYIPILEQLQRLQTSANIDPSSMEAFTVMLNVARNKGKIAAVIAHGNPYNNPQTNEEELRIATEQGKVNINDVIDDLVKQRNPDGTQKYQLIYFNACNETGIPINMNPENPLLVPVITYTDINRGMLGTPGKLKVYWPINERPSLKSKLASFLRRKLS